MTEPFSVPRGTASKLAYLIRLDEDTWLRFTDDQKQQCKDTWLEEAKDIAIDYDIRICCLQLIPDPLFPSTSREIPYIEWQQLLTPPKPDDFRMRLVIEINPEIYTEITPQLRVKITQALMNIPKGTKYRIVLGSGSHAPVLDHGTIA